MSNLNKALADLRQAVADAYADDTAAMTDALGAVRDAQKLLKVIETEGKKNFDDFAGGTLLEGLTHAGSIVEKVDWRIDTKAVIEEMGQDWYDKRCKQVLSRSVRIAPIA